MRSLACFLFAMAIACDAGAQAPTIRSCLEGWDFKLRLPYFPRYRAATCQRPDAPKGAATPYFSDHARSLRLELRAQTAPVMAALGDTKDATAEALASSRAFFDAMMAAEGFSIVGSAARTSAVYGRDRPAGRLRAMLEWRGADELVIDLQEMPAIAPAIALPRPDAQFRFHDVAHAPLFKLPGAQVVSEQMEFGDQRLAAVDNAQVLAKMHGYKEGNSVQLWLPVKAVTYQFPKEVTATEAHIAMREALEAAGWVIERTSGGAFETLEAHYAAAGRDVQLRGRFAYDGYVGATRASIELRDPQFQQRQATVLATFEAFGEYTFAPSWRADGTLADDAAFRLASASHFMASRRRRVHEQSTYSVHVAPVAAASAGTEAARSMASRIKGDLVRLGWDDRRVFVDDTLLAPTPEVAGLAAGVRLVFFECGNRTQDRPGGSIAQCRCWRGQGKADWIRPGQCP